MPLLVCHQAATLLLLGLLILPSQRVPLLCDALLSSFAGSLCLGTLGVHFFLEDAFALFFGFGFVDLVGI
jgi:hypothetical protein